MTSDIKKHPYDNRYAYDNVYGHALDLLRQHRTAAAPDSIHLDVGCGFGHIAEPLERDLGIHYVGVDANRVGLDSLSGRGFETHQLMLNGEESTFQGLQEICAGRTVTSISMLDTLEHLSNGDQTLRALSRIASEQKALVVVSVPNIAHRDIGLKLAFGRWDYTEAGLLDHTHVRFFTYSDLENACRRAGLHPIGRNDVVLPRSDQHFPADHPVLAEQTLLSSTLRRLQARVNPDVSTVQFICACVSGPCLSVPDFVEQREHPRPFLSIITRTQGKRLHTLAELFVALAGQSCVDFELLIVGHRLTLDRQLAVERLIEDNPEWLRSRTRLIRIDEGNRTRPINVGFQEAVGRYIAMLDDDDLPMGHWVETFKKLAESNSGKMLRGVCVRQNAADVSIMDKQAVRTTGSPEKLYASKFDFIDHLRMNHSPNLSLAFPRGIYHDLNFRFDESLTTTEDWDFILRAASIVGVASSPEITCIYRWWTAEESSRSEHSDSEWWLNHQHILHKMDSEVTLFPPGTTTRIRRILDERDELVRELEWTRTARSGSKEEIHRLLEERNKLNREVERLNIALYGSKAQVAHLSEQHANLPRQTGSLLPRKRKPPQSAFGDGNSKYRRDLLLNSPFFDGEWYREQYSNLIAASVEAVDDYLLQGAAYGRNPGPEFDGNWYLRKYPDVGGANENPLIHYLEHGASEGRERRPVISAEERETLRQVKLIAQSTLFDASWYLQQYPDVIASGADPITHYVKSGAAEGRNPGPGFDGSWYLRQYPDVAAAEENPLVHYLEHGKAEDRKIRPVFFFQQESMD